MTQPDALNGSPYPHENRQSLAAYSIYQAHTMAAASGFRFESERSSRALR
jgi:hypothetical protein